MSLQGLVHDDDALQVVMNEPIVTPEYDAQGHHVEFQFTAPSRDSVTGVSDLQRLLKTTHSEFECLRSRRAGIPCLSTIVTT